ncbi:MAG: hypothetical protein GY707_12675, partial [Desulfobacteraceae bacterium]|nr:hypothetical protein [Desulfobacteraceae bacterium]
METQTKSWMGKPFFFFLYLLITIIFISLGPIIFSSNWVSNSDFHACIEISSFFIAIMAAVSALAYFFSKKNRYFLIVALGFFICGSADFAHGLFGFERLFDQSGIDFSKFIPGTYVAGRISLAILIIIAVLSEKRLKKVEHIKQEALFFFMLTLVFGSGAITIAFKLPFPSFIFPDNLISRPVDLISAILFSVAFILVFKRFMKQGDVFSGMLAACILLNILGQIYMSFSKQLFDVFFDVAHWANILSYCMPVLGISIEYFNEMKRLDEEIIGREITENQLKMAKSEFDQIFLAALPLVGIDNSFNIVRANLAFCELFNCDIESVKNKKCYEIMKFDICGTDE